MLKEQVMRMNVSINPNMSLLMETADLLFVYVNQMSPSTLTSDKPYCIPEAEVDRIMKEVCGHLDPEDAKLRFYFQSVPVDSVKSTKMGGTSVGQLLVYTNVRASGCDVQQARAIMHDYSLGRGEPYEIHAFSQFALGIRVCDEYRSITQELYRLNMPELLRLQLAETLSNYHYHVDQICDLLEPLSRKLQLLLQPWWEQILPRMELWRERLSTECGQREFAERINVDTTDMEYLRLSFRVLQSDCSHGMYDLIDNKFCCQVGMEILPGAENTGELSQGQIAALRLLASPDRIEMLRAMTGRVMTPKELTQELGMHAGTVFRDLNSLFGAHLVDLIVDGVHRSYRTNTKYLNSLLKQLGRYINKENNE